MKIYGIYTARIAETFNDEGMFYTKPETALADAFGPLNWDEDQIQMSRSAALAQIEHEGETTLRSFGTTLEVREIEVNEA